MSDEELIEESARQYRRHCERNRHVPQEPNRDSCEVTQRRVRLMNRNGVLAEFERRAGDKLVLLDRE
jgi:hypothetical protein